MVNMWWIYGLWLIMTRVDINYINLQNRWLINYILIPNNYSYIYQKTIIGI